MYVGRVKIKYIASIIGIGFIGALLIYGFAKTYPQSTNKIMPRSTTWVNRIDSYISTEKKQAKLNFRISRKKPKRYGIH